jgi:hypothetical protein
MTAYSVYGWRGLEQCGGPGDNPLYHPASSRGGLQVPRPGDGPRYLPPWADPLHATSETLIAELMEIFFVSRATVCRTIERLRTPAAQKLR